MWLKPDPLREFGWPCQWRRGLRSPINVPLLRLIILFTLHHQQTSHVRPAWGALWKDHGSMSRHPERMDDAQFEKCMTCVYGPNQRAAAFELNKPCSYGILIEFSNWDNCWKECTELQIKDGGTAERDVGGGSTSHFKLHVCVITRSDGALYQFRTTWPSQYSVLNTPTERERSDGNRGK